MAASFNTQCSLNQAVTGKIYCLNQHFLPPATASKFTKDKYIVLKNTQVVIRSNQGNEWVYYWKVLKYTQPSFMGHAFWKENIEDKVKLLGSIVPPKAGWCHSLLYPLPHQESAPLGHTFALPAMKGPLPAELKLRENTEYFTRQQQLKM